MPLVIRYEGKVVRREGQPPTGSRAVDRAYDTLDKVQQYFWDRYGRNSYDNKGGRVEVDVRRSSNAEWFEFGRRPHIEMDENEIAPDLMAYAFAEGMLGEKLPTQTSGSEQRALRVGISQIFASNIEQDFQIGEQDRTVLEEKIWKPTHRPRYDLADPDNVGGAAHTSDYVDDWDHAYENSHIISHAYYNLLTKINRKAAEDIVYLAVTKYMKKNAGFEDFRSATLAASVELFGRNHWTYPKIVDAFADVGLDGTWKAPVS